jgi:thiol-disulfide isomerase/thioredoxin
MVRKFLKLAGCCAAIGLSYIVPSMPGSADDARPVMPNLLLSDGSGLAFPLSRYLGNVMVIEFWSNNCGPCLKELVFLDRLQGDMHGQPVIALAVSEDSGAIAAVRATLARQKLTYLKPFGDPGGAAAQTIGLRGLPTSVVIDRHGRVAMHFEGPQQWDRPDYENRIRLLANEAYP